MGTRAANPVLLTGASGLLGTWLLRMAPRDTEIVALTNRRDAEGVAGVVADLRDAGSTTAAVRLAEPALIIHAAYARDRAAIVDATEHLVNAACEVGADVVFISSDAVFSGDGIPRDEASAPDPIWDYGRWKAAAENATCERSPGAAIVRLPLLVSFDPDDHVVREIRDCAQGGRRTRWHAGETRQPAFAEEVAAAIWRIANLNADSRRGTWHLAGPQRLTRYQIAVRVIGHLGLSRDLAEEVSAPEDVARPVDIAISDERARASIDWCPSAVLE